MLISGYYHWVRHPRLIQKITPEDDIRHRLGAAPTTLAKYYLVTAGWGLFSSTQLREIRDTVMKTTAIQDRAWQNLEFNRLKIDSADSTALFWSFQSSLKEERYAYHSTYSWMNLDSHVVLPECKSIGLAGMLVCALHPSTTIARAPCFTPEGGRRTTEVALFGRDRNRDVKMNNSLPGYDEQLFMRLKRLGMAMESNTSKSIRQLSQPIQFSSEAGTEIGNIARSLGMEEMTAQLLTEQMSNYLRDNSSAITPGRISEVSQSNEGEASSDEEEV